MSQVLDMEAARKYYILEKHRLESFKSWPFGTKDRCCIPKMAEAGFYWCGNERENDTAACFACQKVLDGWESNDDPWAEHRKHAPQCAFVKLGKPERELDVEEFITLFGIVARDYLHKKFTDIKKKCISESDKKREKLKSWTNSD